ncbi:putative transmembrane protein, partial [Toxoplasma gondii TgCatPRC2]
MFLLPVRIRVAKLRRGLTHTTVFSGSFLFCCFSLFIQKKLENALSREKEETVKLRQRLGETRKKLVVSEARRKQESSGFAVDLKSLRSRMK